MLCSHERAVQCVKNVLEQLQKTKSHTRCLCQRKKIEVAILTPKRCEFLQINLENKNDNDSKPIGQSHKVPISQAYTLQYVTGPTNTPVRTP